MDDKQKPQFTPAQQARIDRELAEAYDFDPRDPLFGLSKDDMSGPKLKRRSVMRLMAAAGSLGALNVLPFGSMVSQAMASESGGTLTCGWAGVGQIVTLDPAQINQVVQFQIASNVLSGLMHINKDLVGEGDLAENWTISEDGKQYIFKLREGVTFHNGDKFTAQDVIFTYNRSKDPQKSIHSRVIKDVTAVEALNDYEVKFILARPQASFLTKTLERASGRAMTIVSRGALETMGTSDYGLAPVGTGPFKVVQHQLGQGVILEKFENYYDPERPKLDKVIIKPISDAEPLAAAIEAGDIQLIGGNGIPGELVDRFVANPDLVVSEITGPGFQSVWINPWHEKMRVSDFNKPVSELMKESGFMVRLAIAKALDRDRYLKIAQFGRGTPAYGTINPAMRYYFDETLPETSNQRFDLEEAQKLMADAGYPNGEGFPTLKLSTTPSGRREAQVVANILKKNLNIKIQLETKEWSVSVEEFNTMKWDLRRSGSGGDYDPDDALVDWMQTNSKFNGRTRDRKTMPFGYFSDKEVDALVDEESTEADLPKRRELVQKANKITSDKVASIFLYHPADILVYSKKINFPAESRIPGLVDLDRASFKS
ncbi:ABC transporter, substrate-binding protein (cluster 5, nickel/peptides/opines) [hydrothermal vent metagenome]|uniref:ABC transporter, substrate-binding protein (Cluster 5, nickel/peptides/opines) n=1 Tax=hydrothermal vent metagenome TaxID=652676 RepID=A0A3B0TDB2_9ZZZZ